MMKLIFITTLLAAVHAHAAVNPASLFRDKMVLQRGMDVPVWGEADPGEKVTVSFGGQSETVISGKDGRWMLKLGSMEASAEGREMKVSGANEIIYEDVLVGEVWICSGQSNMAMGISAVPELKKLTLKNANIRYFDVPKVVAFEPQDSLPAGVEWKDGIPPSAVAAGFAHFLEKSADVPVGIILSCWGSSSIEAWMPRDMTNQLPIFKEQMDEMYADKERMLRIKGIIESPKARKKDDDIFIRRQSNIVYNAMIAPLVPYACRGLVWYQGERNAMNYDKLPDGPWYRRSISMTGYGNALKLWIQRYRKEWKRDDFHFMAVMLPGYAKGLEKVAESPTARSWAWMREAQLEALELPNTSVVTTIDLGHLTNIHPKDKLPIGERLALLAQRDTLGNDVVADGPVMKEVKKDKGKLIVQFENTEGLKTKDGKAPTGFWLSEDTKKWFVADAVIINDGVVLSSAELKSPKFIRYAFAAMPKTNLVNSANLPTRPFRTDD